MLKELTKRRENLFREMKNNSAAIFLSARKVFRNKDVEYNFHQNSDFLYMCGINEPDNIVIFVKQNNSEKSYLWRKMRTDLEKTWEGSGLENQDIIENYGFTEIDNIGGVIPAIEEGYFQREIAKSAAEFQSKVDSGELNPQDLMASAQSMLMNMHNIQK